MLGPTVRDGAIVYDDLESAAELPVGWTETQDAGTYRLERRPDQARFGYAVGPHSWKQFLFPARVRLWRARRQNGGFEVDEEQHDDPPLALIGVRSCELHAIDIQDRVFLGGRYSDGDYAARRRDLFVVAVNCFEPGGTCFCVSMGTGPKAEHGYDLALTEILEGEHRFLVEIGSERGGEILARASGPRGDGRRRSTRPDGAVAGAAERMGRTLDAFDLRGLLARTLEHERWDEVASRCLTCGNCTLVCPTCFCSSVEDATDLTGGHAERVRSWDSCFSVEHSYIHGGSIRSSGRSRYRQWLTHKFGTWHDQFGSSGCVGCGRCITWCPVGIDVTEELAALRVGRGGVRCRRLTPCSRTCRSSTACRRRRWSCSPAARATPASRTARCCSARGTRRTRSTSSGTDASRSRPSSPRVGRPRSRRSTPARSSAGRGSSRPTDGISTPRHLDSCARPCSMQRACGRSARQDTAFGYDLMSRFAQVMIERLQWTRLRLLDLYGDGR